jgi:uncharacterized protein YndB with AHSA1/START domain
MAPISSTTEVARSPEEVFAYVTDPTRFVEWQEGVLGGQVEGTEPHGVGDKCLTTRSIGGSERRVTSVITHIEPPSTWGVRGIDGPILATVDVSVAPADGGQRSAVTINLDFAGQGIGKLLVPLVRRSARKEMPANLARLKQRLEGGSSVGRA